MALGTGGIVYTGHGKHFLDNADVVFGIGCSFTPHRITSPSIAPGKKIIHATNDTRDLYKTYHCDLPILGDAKLVLVQLIEAIKDRLGKTTRPARAAQEIARLSEAWLASWQAKLTSNERPINPYRVINEFMRVVDPKDAIVTHDSGSPARSDPAVLQGDAAARLHGLGQVASVGHGPRPDDRRQGRRPRQILRQLHGRRGLRHDRPRLRNGRARRHPDLTVVLNNSTMAIEIPHMKLSHEKHKARDLGGNYAALARELGGWSERVDDPAQIADAFRRARKQTEEGRACLLEFITSAETAFSHRQ